MFIYICNSIIGSFYYKDRSINDSFFYIICYLFGYFMFVFNGVLLDSFIYRNMFVVYFIFDIFIIKKYF